jgi:DNA-binding NarL/FixJ family response regulator
LIRVLTVDDHALLREGIAALVNAESDMELVAEASDESVGRF